MTVKTFTYKEITFRRVADGRVETADPARWLTLAYWPRPADQCRSGSDPWTFETIMDGVKIPVSHPSELGCMIGIRKALIDVGMIKIPADNAHLDDKDAEIYAETFRNYDARQGVRNGDFLDMGDGTFKRVCHLWDHGAQVTIGGSFSISKRGGISYSGALDPSILFERFEPTDETREGRFWFFHHGMMGAGRGVDVMHKCRVFKLVDLTMTEDEARNHPAAKDCAEFWGQNHHEHVERINSLMIGEMR